MNSENVCRPVLIPLFLFLFSAQKMKTKIKITKKMEEKKKEIYRMKSLSYIRRHSMSFGTIFFLASSIFFIFSASFSIRCLYIVSYHMMSFIVSSSKKNGNNNAITWDQIVHIFFRFCFFFYSSFFYFFCLAHLNHFEKEKKKCQIQSISVSPGIFRKTILACLGTYGVE